MQKINELANEVELQVQRMRELIPTKAEALHQMIEGVFDEVCEAQKEVYTNSKTYKDNDCISKPR